MTANVMVFGADNCEKCKRLLDKLGESSVPYVFIDAFADDTQNFCDEHDVDDLPHVQILDDMGVVVFVAAGDFDPVDVINSHRFFSQN